MHKAFSLSIHYVFIVACPPAGELIITGCTRIASTCSIDTPSVVGVPTPKIHAGASDTPKKVKGNIRPTSQQRDVGISHFQAAVKCTKHAWNRVTLPHHNSHHLATTRTSDLFFSTLVRYQIFYITLDLHMKRPKMVCGWGSPRPRWGSLWRSQTPSRLRRGTPPPHFSPLDLFDYCSWTFVWTGMKDEDPQFLKRGCAHADTADSMQPGCDFIGRVERQRSSQIHGDAATMTGMTS